MVSLKEVDCNMPNASDAAAVAEFEKLLMATSRVTIRYLGGSKKPAVATLALDLDGTRALSLVVYIDPQEEKDHGQPAQHRTLPGVPHGADAAGRARRDDALPPRRRRVIVRPAED